MARIIEAMFNTISGKKIAVLGFAFKKVHHSSRLLRLKQRIPVTAESVLWQQITQTTIVSGKSSSAHFALCCTHTPTPWFQRNVAKHQLRPANCVHACDKFARCRNSFGSADCPLCAGLVGAQFCLSLTQRLVQEWGIACMKLAHACVCQVSTALSDCRPCGCKGTREHTSVRVAGYRGHA